MSLERGFFGRYRPAFAKLEPAGFQKDGNRYIYRETFLDGQFEARITVQPEGEIRGQVIDLDTEEEYLPIRARHQVGGFVGSVREAYLEVLEQVRTRCFAPVDFVSDQANRVSGMIGGIWGTAPVFPWEKYPGNAAFHCDDNDKWFALVLTVAYGKLASAKAGQARPEEPEGNEAAGRSRQEGKKGKKGTGHPMPHDVEEIVEVANLKADPEEIPALTQEEGIFPAWHMNKKHWISVILDDTLPDERVMELIRSSRWLVEKKHSAGHVSGDAWIIPSNPKIYDIDAGFEKGNDCIEWHQHNNIKAGDEVYIYSASPNSAIMYRCLVEASDLTYHGMFVESKGYTRSMRIRLIEKYPKDRFPLSFMRANGGSPIRSARRMPAQLLEAMRKADTVAAAGGDT